MTLENNGPLVGGPGNRDRKKGCAGFTLIELMVSIAILGTLAGIGIPAYMTYVDKARNARAIGDVSALQKETKLYESIHETLPDNLNQIGMGALLDPWGNPYKYLKFSKTTLGKARKDRFLVPLNTDFDLYSMGKDGKTQTPLTAADSFDDILRANNGRFIGLGSRF